MKANGLVQSGHHYHIIKCM